ncbi:MAG: hypothetical protein J0H74_01440 [Chitinophagaceae bacterium]|nr:hypothetical protein [Chitinophagaceae bacterium]
MKSKIHEHQKETNMHVSKKLFVLATILTGTLFATTAYSQVYVHVGFNLPVRRVYVAPPPPPTVVYQQYPAPVCQDGYDQNVYAPAPATVVYENEFPGYAYYNYPVWNGHYRDRVYYEHYRPYFNRDYRDCFDNGRFSRERFERRRYDRDRDYDHDRGEHRGWYKHDRW